MLDGCLMLTYEERGSWMVKWEVMASAFLRASSYTEGRKDSEGKKDC